MVYTTAHTYTTHETGNQAINLRGQLKEAIFRVITVLGIIKSGQLRSQPGWSKWGFFNECAPNQCSYWITFFIVPQTRAAKPRPHDKAHKPFSGTVKPQ